MYKLRLLQLLPYRLYNDSFGRRILNIIFQFLSYSMNPSLNEYQLIQWPPFQFPILIIYNITLRMQQENQITEEISCSVCMCLFRSPVTIQCGHTFCRSCLLNYTRTKSFCPICRKSLAYLSEYPPQDCTVSSIVEYIKMKESKQQQSGNKKQQVSIEHFQNLLLLDIKSSELLLPYTKIVGTFELQSPTLLKQLQRFVVRQQMPFDKCGVVSKLIYLNQLRYNVYQCVIEGKSFCQITNQEVQKKDDEKQDYFYRVCKAKVIYEDEQINHNMLQQFYSKFSQIKDKKILVGVYKSINPQKLYSKTNTIAAYYSIMKIISEPDKKKYDIIISFDQEKRQKFLTEFLAKSNFDVSKSPHKFLSVPQQYGIRRELLPILFSIFFGILVLAFNSDSFGQLL